MGRPLAASQTSQLIARLIDQVTGPAGKIGRSLQGINDAVARNNSRLDAMRGRMVDAMGAGYLLAKALGSPLKAAMEFESAMADVKKVVDFDTPDAFKTFQRDVLEMSTKIPMAGKALTEIVAAAGQSGLALQDLLPFTEMAAKVGVAFDISAGQAGEALAKLKTGLGLTVPQTAKMADAMNHLSNAMASSASDILDVVRRVGANAKQFGFNEIQVSAFASAIVAAGAQSEVAATSFNNMGRALTKGASATKGQRRAFAALKLDSVKVAKAMQKDAVGTTLEVFKRLAALPAHMRASIASDLFGDEARALGPLLTNLPLLKQALELVANEANYAGSANKEYAARAETFANAVQLMKNRMERLAITVGTILIPPLSDLMERLAPIVDWVKDFAEAHPKLTRNVIAAASGLVAFRIAAVAASWAGLFMFGGLLKLTKATLGTVAVLGKLAKALLIAPAIRAVSTALAVLRSTAIGFAGASAIAGMGTGVALFGRSLLSLLNPIFLVKKAVAGLKWAVRGALLGTGIGAVVVAVGVAAEWAMNNWNNLKVAFNSFLESFNRGIEPLRKDDLFGPVVESIQNVIRWMQGLTTEGDPAKFAEAGTRAGGAVAGAFIQAANAIRDVRDAIAWVSEKWAALNEFDQRFTSTIFEGAKSAWADFSSWWDGVVASFQEKLSDLPGTFGELGSGAIQSLWDGMVSKFDALLTWLTGLPGRIASAVGNIDLSGIIQWPSLPKWAKRIWGSDEEADQPAPSPIKPQANGAAPSQPDRPIDFRPARTMPPQAPTVTPQVDVIGLDGIVVEAQSAGQKMEDALSVSARPQLDKSDLMDTLDIARRINAELSKFGPLAQQAGRTARSWAARKDHFLHDGGQ